MHSVLTEHGRHRICNKRANSDASGLRLILEIWLRHTSVRSGTVSILQRRSKHAVFRILALNMIGVLLLVAVPSVNCMKIPLHQDATVECSQGCSDGADRDDGCCSFCVCCHFAGARNPADLTLSLVPRGFLAPEWNPLPLQSSISPFDHPPRG